MMVAELDALQAETVALRQEVLSLREQNAALQAQLAAALARIAELENRPPEPPAFVKPNTPKPERQPRKKRNPEHNRARRLETPTRIHQHALDCCPDCGLHLHGGTLARRRQVIELPEPQPIEVIEHQVIKRWCAWCKRWQAPKLDLTGQVLDQSRIGVRLTSLIAYLRQTLRLPFRRIQAYLETFHQLHLSIGELSELLHHVRRATQPAVDKLKTQARASPVLHADETTWREAGQNGHIWAFSTPGTEEAIRYYEYDASRAGAVAKRILGGTFQGHLVSDFYAGYNIYAGKHQRCWVREEHAKQEAVVVWVDAVKTLYSEAQAFVRGEEEPSQAVREAKYVELVEQAHVLGRQYARAAEHACKALAKRILRHEDELFQFVLIEGLSADNNLAERSIRPLVVVRKISGGTQSAEGSKTRMALASLFETWQARGLNPFEECLKLLRQTPLPQV
jgi:transposase